MKPAISVLMPARNAEPYLAASVGSILAQTDGDLELLAVDDASTDGTLDALKRWAAKDTRVRVWSFKKNRGQALCSNFMLGKARGRYIARMDADDVSLPHRFAVQRAALERDPSLGLVSSTMRLWDGGIKRDLAMGPLDHESIRATFAFENAVANPAVMLRRSALGRMRYQRGHYAEDYEIWSRLILRTRFMNLAEPLVDYRVHAQQAGNRRPMDQYESATRVRWAYLRALGFRLDPQQRRWQAAVCRPFLRRRPDWLEGVRSTLMELLAQNRRLKALDGSLLLALAQDRFAHYCAGLGLKGLSYYVGAGGPLRARRGLARANAKAFLKHYLRPERVQWL